MSRFLLHYFPTQLAIHSQRVALCWKNKVSSLFALNAGVSEMFRFNSDGCNEKFPCFVCTLLSKGNNMVFQQGPSNLGLTLIKQRYRLSNVNMS